MDGKRADSGYRDVEENVKDLALAVRRFGSCVSEYYVLKASYMITFESRCGKNRGLEYTAATPGVYMHKMLPQLPAYAEGKRPLHQHNFMELMIVLEGKVIQRIEGHIYEYEAGQCCVLNTQVKHCEEFTGEFTAAFLMLSDDFIRYLQKMDLMPEQGRILRIRQSPILSFLSEMAEQKSRSEKVYLDFRLTGGGAKALPAIRESLELILMQTRAFEPGSYLLAAGMMVRIFSILEDSKYYDMKRITMQECGDDRLFLEIAGILEQNDGRISRSELERQTHYNGDYLNWIVKKHTGRNLTEYGQMFCLAKAEWMLINTDFSVSAIIRQLGFSNRSYFYRIFEEKYGMTPRDYRAHATDHMAKSDWK